MSTHNICFGGVIKKKIYRRPLLSGVFLNLQYSNKINTLQLTRIASVFATVNFFHGEIRKICC